ncbi:Saccharopine dehydrogenase-domain-containing protein [Boletus reticuloceps]|uniref:Saccharopine dehydrogenase-domain-containing protein n=1 Tax=Boletus reticuloceps TaxID=495285 RepID=A0A8I2YYW2_9AGAM|nr:Saccharopine dehydrogenase-domain-containing protein [Boletus reticuloceps]
MLDILLLGATGYTGRLIARYLATHPQRTAFSFGLAARSDPKLKALVREYADLAEIPAFVVDVTNADDVDRVVQRARVIINTVGPYWRWGTPVVQACVRHGRHYVDLTGEAPWVRDIIVGFDFAASHSGSVIVPCAGLDSVPSDVLAYLGNRTLKAFAGPATTVDTSTSAWELSGTGISGGTFLSILSHLEDVPKHKWEEARRDFALSPIKGVKSPPRKVFYLLPVSKPPVQGALYLMSIVNLQIVQRSWGLFELATRNPRLVLDTSRQSSGEHEDTTGLSYGSQFKYEEFLALPSRLHSLLVMLSLVIVAGAMWLFPPVRWMARRLMPRSGDGPPEEQFEAGALKITNITTSLPNAEGRTTTVRTTFRGKGEPGYFLSSIIIVECALSLVLEADHLPSFAKRGGVLTPMTAFGDVLIERLKTSGRITIESEVVL